MSLCIRTISNKLTPFVGTRKPITHLDRQLPKHVKESSAFLQDFLAGGVILNSKIQQRETAFNLMVKPLKTSQNVVVWNYKLKREGNWSIGKGRKESFQDVGIKFSNKLLVTKASKVFSVMGKENVQSEAKNDDNKPAEATGSGDGKPSLEQLNNVYEVLRVDLPHFFINSIDYKIYGKNIVFENNIKGTVTKGIYEYVKQTAMLRIIGHVKFAYVKFDVLKITVHPEDSSIKVRWRIRGITGYKILFTFWKYKLWNLQSTIDQLESWHDGFSTFYVDGSGKVIKHVADKMMPDQDKEEISTKDKSGMAAKLALFLGLFIPQDFMTDVPLLMSKSVKLKRDTKC
ncbi:uncharacterized protein [Venturia canescens]|uniref:uncharacterized protein n=1 Tax=Venturia canescens TaxID=32260 RepID=UPI001C9D16BF|nr:uncharacterized protein LOC122410724 [Venturia canescens]